MKKVFFASDFHLGVPNLAASREREKRIIRWMNQIETETSQLYLVGDVFDFWFEYRKAVPKGYVRLLGKLAEWADGGIAIDYFTGNHDLWMFQYFEEELGIPTHREPILRKHGQKNFFIGHGDGLGPGDFGYKRLKKVFTNKLCQKLFGSLHPNIGIQLANFYSGKSREQNDKEPDQFLGKENEWLYQYAEQKLKQQPEIDYFIFGHRHLPLDLALSNSQSRYINLGEWINFNSFAVYDGQEVELQFFEKEAVPFKY
ncbi:MAG: UDP-2,3-diacylglucosamine diphosphatase [Bacteroidota bacterium]